MSVATVALTPEQNAYVLRMAALVGGRDPIRLLRGGVAKIAAAASGLSPRARTRPAAPGKWSVHEIVGHLLDYEVATAWRLRRMIAEPGARVEGWDQDRWAAAFRYQAMPFAGLVRGLRAARAANLQLVDAIPRRALRDAWYDHAERGREDSARFLVMWAGHDLNHLEQIRALREGRRA